MTSWRASTAGAPCSPRRAADRVNAADLAEVRARLGIARHLDALALTDEAIDHLERVIALEPHAPHASLALAYLRLGEAHDRLNAASQRDSPPTSSASRLAPTHDPFNIRRRGGRTSAQGPEPAARRGIPPLARGLARARAKDVVAAATSLERAIALNPRDPVARYRYGRVARRPDATIAARSTQFEQPSATRGIAPAPIVGEAYLEAARIHERAGRRDEAIAAYRVAVDALRRRRRDASRRRTRAGTLAEVSD